MNGGPVFEWVDDPDRSKHGVQVNSRQTESGLEYRWRYVFEGGQAYWNDGLPRPSDLAYPRKPDPDHPPGLTRKSVLDQAAAVVLKNREAQYGSPEDSFGTIAEFWTTFLRRRGLLVEGKTLTSAEVAALMALLKLARIAETINHADSIVDLAGYAACLGEVSSQTKAP